MNGVIKQYLAIFLLTTAFSRLSCRGNSKAETQVKVNYRSYYVLFYLLVITVLSACSTNQAPKPVIKNLKAIAETPKNFDSETTIPVSLSVLQEINDGENLVIKAKVKALAPRELALKFLKDAVVKLQTFNQSTVVKTKEVTLLSLKSFGQPFSLPFEFAIDISANFASSYQIELAWGGSVKEIKAAEAKVSNVTLESTSLEQRELCDTSPCELTYAFSGLVKNVGSGIVNEVTLGVSYVWEEKGSNFDLSQYIPENEEMLVVNSLNLNVGDTTPVKLNLEQRIPVRADGQYRPVVRVLAVK